MSTQAINELLAKQAITEQIYRYSRGLDRMNKEMAYSVWHEDGTALYHDDIFEGSGHGFVDWVWKAHEGMTHHAHQMNNILIELDGQEQPEKASSETYATVTLILLPDENGQQGNTTAITRYIDQWSLRDGKWAIDHREHVLDCQLLNGVPVATGKKSRRDRQDPSFTCMS